jgi:hypothetical protein
MEVSSLRIQRMGVFRCRYKWIGKGLEEDDAGWLDVGGCLDCIY